MLQRSVMWPTHELPWRTSAVSSSNSLTASDAHVLGEEGEDASPVVFRLGLGVAGVQRVRHLHHPRGAVVVAHERVSGVLVDLDVVGHAEGGEVFLEPDRLLGEEL